MKLLIDCGGSSVKIEQYVQGVRSATHPFNPTSLDEFYKCIEYMAKGNDPAAKPCVVGIAISLCGDYDCGDYDYINEEVIRCCAYPFLIGRLQDNLRERFKCSKVHIVNDGDAHVLALRSVYAQKGLCADGAVNLALGTGAAFGALDSRSNLFHNWQGHNWEVGCWQCDTRADHKELYWALGSEGLKILEKTQGDHAYISFGHRLAHFLGRDLVRIFHPRIIGLSGGIVAAHFPDIEEGIRRECEERGYCVQGGPLNGVDIYLSPEKDSVMQGLADLLDHDKTGLRSAVGRAADSVKSAGKQFGELLRKLFFK